MAVTVQWDDETAKNALVWTLVGRWTWFEFGQAWRDMTVMLDEVDGKVCLIFDVRRMSMLPPDITTKLKQDYLKPPPKAGRLLAVGVDADLQLFWNMFTDLPYAKHMRMRYFETLEEASEYARTHRD